jgi:hypothetical protein
MKNFLLSILLIPIFSFSQEFTIQELNSGEDFIFKGRNQLHKIVFTNNKSEGVVLDLNNKTLLRVIKTDFKYTLIDNLDSNYQWVFYKNEGKIGRLQNNRSIGILEDILKPDEYLPSENNINEESNNVNNFFLPSPYFGFEPESKKFEKLKDYRLQNDTTGKRWFDSVSNETNEIGNGNYTITITGDRLNLKEQTVIYVTKENKPLLIAEFLELKYSYSRTVEDYFDRKISNNFEITSPAKKYKNESLKIEFPEGIKINIPVIDGYLFNLSLTQTNQNFSRYIGYTQSLDTIRNKKGKIRTIRKGKKRGFAIDVPVANVRSSNSENDIDGASIGAGFYNSYKKSDVDEYLDSDEDAFNKNGREMMDVGFGDIFFGVKDADVPKDYIKSFSAIYFSFFDVKTNPYADVTFTSLDGDAIAIALGMNDDCVGNIAIDIDKWNNATNLEKYFIMFHELGHDIFNLSHSDGIRLMATNQFNIKNELELGEMIFEMFYYVAKMDFKNNCIIQ